MRAIVPDVLAPGLRLVFCGTAPSKASAAARAYYARPGNRFWPALHEAGFTPRRFRPAEYAALLADIIDAVYEKVGGFSKKEAAEIVEIVVDTIKQTLEQGEKIKISGFGNFVVREKKARIGRNPQTGEEITISARRVLTFKPSQVLKNAFNGGEPVP